MRVLSVFAAWAVLAGGPSLPTLLEGDASSLPVQTRDGGYALFELRVSAAGSVSEIMELANGDPFAELLRDQLKGWRFEAATDDEGVAIPHAVLVAAVYRAPVLVSAIPPRPKTPAADNVSPDIAFPVTMIVPPYPPQAHFPGVVLLEIEIDVSGDVESSRVVGPPGAFDGASLDTIEYWKFRPARRDGNPVASRAYVLFGYRPPVTPKKP